MPPHSLVLGLLALVLQGNPFPHFPDSLRVAQTEGSVTVRFRTDGAGRPDSATMRVVASTHELFTTAVVKVLPHWRLSRDTALERTFVFMMQDKLATLRADPSGRSVYVTASRPAGSERNVYFEFQVAKKASPLPSNPAPQYPDRLRASGIQGEVRARFVVDALGLVDSATFRSLTPAYPAFIDAVRAVLPALRFSPAQVAGRPVSQVVEMSFVLRP